MPLMAATNQQSPMPPETDEELIEEGAQKTMRKTIPSGKHTKNYGKLQFLMGKSTISMAMFNSYVCLPEGIACLCFVWHSLP